jgi:hypothetical protein
MPRHRRRATLHFLTDQRVVNESPCSGYISARPCGALCIPCCNWIFGKDHDNRNRPRGFRAPMIRPAIAWPRRVAVPARIHTAPFAHFRHRRAPAVVFVDAPWYSGYDESTYVAPDEQIPSDSSPTADPNMILRVWVGERRLTRSRRKMAANGLLSWCAADGPSPTCAVAPHIIPEASSA